MDMEVRYGDWAWLGDGWLSDKVMHLIDPEDPTPETPADARTLCERAATERGQVPPVLDPTCVILMLERKAEVTCQQCREWMHA
jgi:hypothetical protein